MSKTIHLTLEDRKLIEQSIRNNNSKSSIANSIGKDPSTIAKEIRLHRIKRLQKNSRFFHSDCALLKQCKVCNHYCENYVPSTCKRRDRSPGACNGCTKPNQCHMTQYSYSADMAHKQYLESLSDSRMGINYSTSLHCSLPTG